MASGLPQPAGGMFLADGFGHQLLADAEDDAHRIPSLGDGQPSSCSTHRLDQQSYEDLGTG